MAVYRLHWSSCKTKRIKLNLTRIHRYVNEIKCGHYNPELFYLTAPHPKDCRLNFAVPSERTIHSYGQKYKIQATDPGILDNSLDAFGKAKPGIYCKVSIDGKKLAYGFGKHLGDENLCGHEDAPTLKDRQERFEHELTVIRELSLKLAQMTLEVEGLHQLPTR